MSLNYQLANALSKIKNGQKAYIPYVYIVHTKLSASIVELLCKEGVISGYSLENSNNRPNQIRIDLKYFRGLPVIKDIECVSRPGKRIYKSVKEISNYSSVSSIFVISTVKGILSDREALLQNVGGEVLCKIS
jgi:small subunit ribosomal protein S8